MLCLCVVCCMNVLGCILRSDGSVLTVDETSKDNVDAPSLQMTDSFLHRPLCRFHWVFLFFKKNTTESSSQVSVFCFLMMDCCECVLLMRVEVSVDSTHKNTMCAPSGRTFLPAPRFPQVIHAVLIPTVMALSWGLDAPSGPPHFCPWPP